VLERERAGDRRQRDERADRQVDAADEDHEQLPIGQRRQRRDLDEQVREVVAREEEGRQQCQDEAQQQQDQRRANADHPQARSSAHCPTSVGPDPGRVADRRHRSPPGSRAGRAAAAPLSYPPASATELGAPAP
jgi:hypothetical protein